MTPDQFEESLNLLADPKWTETERRALMIVSALSIGERIADGIDLLNGQLAEILDRHESEDSAVEEKAR